MSAQEEFNKRVNQAIQEHMGKLDEIAAKNNFTEKDQIELLENNIRQSKNINIEKLKTFGLNEIELDIISKATPNRKYYLSHHKNSK